MALPLDKIVDKIVAIGVPGIVLLIALHAVGFAGAAALTAALAALGGPLGMLGGLALLGVLVLISKGISSYGFEKILSASIDKMRSKGRSKEDIISDIRGYRFISKSLKEKMINHVRNA
jgi:hypothetical protein